MTKPIEMTITMNETIETAGKTTNGFYTKLKESKGYGVLASVIWMMVGFFMTLIVVNAMLSRFYAVVSTEGNSMNPTMPGNTVVLVAQNSEGLTHGSIISTTKEFAESVKTKESGGFVKRVIGMPGDTITIKDNVFYRNGDVLVEPYVREVAHIRNADQTIVVPEDAVFVMGDNRNVSFDSRHFGAIPLAHIDGIVKAQISPLNAIHHFE